MNDENTDERVIRLEDEETYRLLSAATKPRETTGEAVRRLVQEHTEHTLTTDVRSSHGWYIKCEDCGRTENSVSDMADRPCKDGIAVDE